MIDNKETSKKNVVHQSKKTNIEYQSKGNMEIAPGAFLHHFYADNNKKPGQQFMPQDLFESIVAIVGYLYFYSDKKESMEGLTQKIMKEYERMIINDDLEVVRFYLLILFPLLMNCETYQLRL